MNPDSDYYRDTRQQTATWAHAQAAQCKRWLENSGPLYTDMDCIFVSASPEMIIVTYEGDDVSWHRRWISYASWLMCQGLAAGTPICLKVRCDDYAANTI